VHLHTVTLTIDQPDRGSSNLDAQAVVDILWAVARPPDRIEHIVARLHPPHLHIGIYTIGTGPAEAYRRGLGLIRRAIESSPMLCAYRVALPRD
jgi:hypothetical protein